MKYLKCLSRNAVVLASIHQPRAALWRLFDSVSTFAFHLLEMSSCCIVPQNTYQIGDNFCHMMAWSRSQHVPSWRIFMSVAFLLMRCGKHIKCRPHQKSCDLFSPFLSEAAISALRKFHVFIAMTASSFFAPEGIPTGQGRVCVFRPKHPACKLDRAGKWPSLHA
jgi:hypothetical protein